MTMRLETTRQRGVLFVALFAFLAVVALVVSGCSGSASEGSSAAETSAPSETAGAFPLTVASDDGRTLTLDKKPERIVSLSASSTESLYAIAAGDAVVVADKYSTYPEEAPNDENLSARATNAEALLTYNPDLVVVSWNAEELIGGLDAVGVPVLVMLPPTTVDGAYEQIERLGQATGHAEEATGVTSDMRQQIEKTVAASNHKVEGKSYFHEVTIDYYTVSNDTFLGDVYSLFGLSSIAPEDASGYPQLTEEAIIAANPDYIFLVDHTSEKLTPQQVADRPGWSAITAVQEGRIIPLDEDLASRWGPRLPQLVEQIAENL